MICPSTPLGVLSIIHLRKGFCWFTLLVWRLGRETDMHLEKIKFFAHCFPQIYTVCKHSNATSCWLNTVICGPWVKHKRSKAVLLFFQYYLIPSPIQSHSYDWPIGWSLELMITSVSLEHSKRTLSIVNVKSDFLQYLALRHRKSRTVLVINHKS